MSALVTNWLCRRDDSSKLAVASGQLGFSPLAVAFSEPLHFSTRQSHNDYQLSVVLVASYRKLSGLQRIFIRSRFCLRWCHLVIFFFFDGDVLSIRDDAELVHFRPESGAWYTELGRRFTPIADDFIRLAQNLQDMLALD